MASSSPHTFLVGTIPVTTMETTTTITVTNQPSQSPPQTTVSSSSVSRTPSPPKKKKQQAKKRVAISPQPLSMIPHSQTIPLSPQKPAEYPLQKDTEFKAVFAPADIPKHKLFSVKTTPMDIKLGSNNSIAPQTIPEGSEGYLPIFHYLWNSPVADALSVSTSRHYHHLLQEFWWTATFDEATRCIEGTVLRGSRDISIDVDVVRHVLKLDYLAEGERYVKPATAEEYKEMLMDCGYNFNIKDEAERTISSTPLKARLPGVYHFVLANIIQSLGGNSGSINQANHYNMQIMHGLITGRRVDYAAIIFADMVNKVTHSPRVTTVPFSRFFSLIIKNQLGHSLYHQEGYAFQKPAKMNQQVFKLNPNGHVAQLSIHIRSTLCKLFPSVYPSDESLLVAQNSEDASAIHQAHSLSIEDTLLIEPSARPISSIRTMTRAQTSHSQLAGVKKRQQGSQKGKSKVRKSPTPRDNLGAQANPPAVSKKTAGKRKRKPQAASPETSLGRGSEELGPTQPISVSVPLPAALSSSPPASAPLTESAMSQADSEAATLPHDIAGQSPPVVEGPQPFFNTSAFNSLMQDISMEAGSADVDEGSADSLEDLDFGFLLGNDETSKQLSSAEVPSYVSREFFLRDESSAEDVVEEVFAVSSLPDIDLSCPPTNPPSIPQISTIPIASISLSTPSTIISSQPIPSAAFVTAGENAQPVTPLKWLTLRDLMNQVNRLTDAMKVNCSSVVGLVDAQQQCHQAILDTNTCTVEEYSNIGAGINGLMELYQQIADLSQQFASTIQDELKPAQGLLSSRFERMADRQAILNNRFSEFKSSVKSSIAGLREHLQEEKIDRTAVNELIKLISDLERSSTTLISKVEMQFGEMDLIKSAVIDNDNTVRSLIRTVNDQTVHLGKLTTAVNNLMTVAKEDMFSNSDRMKLDKIIDLLSVQQQSPVITAVTTTPTPAAVSEVVVVPLNTTTKGEESTIAVESTPAAVVSECADLSTDSDSYPYQQVASPAPSKGEQSNDQDVLVVNVEEEEEENPISAEEELRKRKGKISNLSSADPSNPMPLAERTIVRLVAQEQRRIMAERAARLDKIVQGEGSSDVDPRSLAAAIGLNVSEIEAAAKQAHEDEATRALVAEEARNALMDADDEIREEVLNRNLSAEQSQVLLLQAFEKKQKEKNARKKQELESLRTKYLLLTQNRVAKEQISAVTATSPDQGKTIVAHIKRKGVGATHSIPNIRNSDLGVTEWVEFYLAIAQKTTTVYVKLLERLSSYFDQIRKMEEKLDIADSVLKIDLPSSQVIKPASKKRKVAEPAQSSSHFLDSFLQSDGLINSSLPAGVPAGDHGEVIRHPELGMFFETFQHGKRFFRISDLDLSTSEILLAMYNCCKSTSNDTQFISLLLEEFNKRRNDPIIKKFRRSL